MGETSDKLRIAELNLLLDRSEEALAAANARAEKAEDDRHAEEEKRIHAELAWDLERKRWDAAEEALAAARRECDAMREALTTIRDALNRPWLMGSEVNRVAVDCANAVLEAVAALAAPAAGEEGTR